MVTPAPSDLPSPHAEDLRNLLKTIAEEGGVIVRCVCGKGSFIPGRHCISGLEEFRMIHRACGVDFTIEVL